jgi:hypothetical protein
VSLKPETGVMNPRKARGAISIPELCDDIVAWAVRSPEDDVLGPSCGEASTRGQTMTTFRRTFFVDARSR